MVISVGEEKKESLTRDYEREVCPCCNQKIKNGSRGRPSLISKYKDSIILLYNKHRNITRVTEEVPLSYATVWKIIKEYKKEIGR